MVSSFGSFGSESSQNSTDLQIVQKVVADVSNASKILVQLNRSSLHISAKHYGLEQSIDVMPGLIALSKRSTTTEEKKNKILGSGAYSIVKKAHTPERQPLARRICKIKPSDQVSYKESKKMIETLQKLKGLPGVIDLLGACEYEKPDQTKVVLTYYPRYEANLFTILFRQTKRTLKEGQKLDLANQLLMALENLPGAHGDV